MYNPGWWLLPHVHRQRIRVRRWHPLRRRDVAGQRVPDLRRSDQRRPTRMGTTRWWLWPCSHRLSQCFNTSQRPTKANANSFWITDLKNFANKLVLRCRPTQLCQSYATSNWRNVLQKQIQFSAAMYSIMAVAATCNSKSSCKVEQTGALNFCLHAVGSFIHLHHVRAGLQNLIHLCHPAALAGYVLSNKN